MRHTCFYCDSDNLAGRRLLNRGLLLEVRCVTCQRVQLIPRFAPLTAEPITSPWSTADRDHFRQYGIAL